MSASLAAKNAGLTSLAEVSRMTGKPANTLHNWYANERQLFEIVIAGCVVVKARDIANHTA